MKKERFFGKNGQTAFLGAAVLVLLICYIDNFHGGSAWIPTYFQHVAVNCQNDLNWSKHFSHPFLIKFID